jgi:hypothetical protein
MSLCNEEMVVTTIHQMMTFIHSGKTTQHESTRHESVILQFELQNTLKDSCQALVAHTLEIKLSDRAC